MTGTDRSIDEFYDALQALGHPVATAEEIARALDCTQEEADRWLDALADAGRVGRRDVERDPVIWYPIDWNRQASREHVVAFPDRRELVVEHPEQFTRARLSQFAYLVDTSGSGGYLYRIREEDVWGAPYDDLGELLSAMRAVLGERHPTLEEWVERQWERARQFALRTHDDGYTILEAESTSLMGNVARRVLDEDQLHAPISDTESWVVEGREGEIKRLLYDEGYPVRDDRDLDTGDPLDVELNLELRDYQREWVERFSERKAGVLVGPPGSGKTVAGMGAMAAVGGETLILVPSRELAAQWHASLLANTSLEEGEIGEYHGGEKEVRPVTIATYQTVGMDRHRRLFDERRWGLIVYDECLTGDTVVETPAGKTTFTALDEEHGLDDGWNTDVDLAVRTYGAERGEYEWDTVTGVYKTTAPVQRITTNTGRELTATPGHTHLVFDPSTCEIHEQRGVSEGDYLIQPAPSPETETETPSNEELARAELMGWFIGDGHLNRYDDIEFSFARRASEQIEIVAGLCDGIGADWSTFENARGDSTLWVPKLRNEIEWLGPPGDKTATVSVPDGCYSWPANRIGALLRGLFDAEGSVDAKGRIEFNTTSDRLATDVSLLLQKLGIVVRRHVIERENARHSSIHRLYVPSFYGPRFEKHVGFRLDHKAARLTEGKTPAMGLPAGSFLSTMKADLKISSGELGSMMNVSATTVDDVVHGRYRLGQHRLHELADGLTRYANDASDASTARRRYNVTFDRLADRMDVSAATAYRRLESETETARDAVASIVASRQERAAEYVRRLERLTNVTVLRVDEIEDVGAETVYDFETESHTFLANGLLTHNCHHIPSSVFRRSADLQSKHRLGLSVDGDTVIPVNREGSVSMERIEDLATEYLDTEVGVAAVDDAKTLSVTSDGQVKWSSIGSVMRHAHGEAMYTVRAGNGRQVTVTEDHSLIVFDTTTTEITSKRPAELGETDYLLQPTADGDLRSQPSGCADGAGLTHPLRPGSSRTTCENPSASGEEPTRIDVMALLDEGYVLLEEEVPDELFGRLRKRGIGSDTDRNNWARGGSLPIDVSREIDVDDQYIEGVYVRRRDEYVPPTVPIDDFARLVGLFVADGALDDHRIEFYATDTDDRSEVERFRDLIHRLCPEADIPTVQNGENCTTVRISGPLVRMFRAIGLSNGARDKTVPDIVLSTPSAYEPFIEGLIIGDGHRRDRERDRTTVTISTSSDRLAQGVNLMLSALGYTGGNYRRTCPIGIRGGQHDVTTNHLVRFNPKNRTKQPRNAMVPFTDALRDMYASIERTPEPDRPTAEIAHPLKNGLDRRRRLSTEEVSTLTRRTGAETYEWLCDTDVAFLSVDSVERSDPQGYVYDISTEERNFLGNHLFCHNSATPVRESDDEAEIYTLIGPPIGTDWSALFDAGFVVEPEVEIRYVPWGSDEAESEYASSTGHERRQTAASNPAKLPEIRRLLEEHDEEKTLIFVDWLEQGKRYEEALSVPFLSGETRYARRERLLSEFRHGARDTLIVSRVGDEGIDLPDASLAIVASGLGGSRRQGAQRAGRTMRPVGGARIYVLATRGTEEEEFARRQVRHLQSKGIHVMEADVDGGGDESA